MGESKIHSFKLFIPTTFFPGSLIGAHSTAEEMLRSPNLLYSASSLLPVSNNSVGTAFYCLTPRLHRASSTAPNNTCWIIPMYFGGWVGGTKVASLKSGKNSAITFKWPVSIVTGQQCQTQNNEKCTIFHQKLTSTDLSHLQLLSKMAPLIGKEMSQRLFLQRFATLCVDPLFHVRKVCAANFGDFSGVVGSDPTEQTLVSTYTSWKGTRGNICKLDSEVVREVTSMG